VTHDTDPFDLESTTIPLERLGEWCSRISARRLLIVLDCCFSGGMGAKALQVTGVPRDMQSVDVRLNRISGDGRVILTASGPTQRAWESPRLGHGFLTLHLLEALQGPEEIREGDRVGVLRLLDYVVRRVVDAARQIRRDQHPAVRGTFDGEFTWPIMSPGPNYRAAFPDFGEPIATNEIASLALFGFPQLVIEAWAGEIPHLNQLQVDAINGYGILRGKHLVASAPTSSGKTMLGELAAVRGALDRRRTLFLMPLKALVNDKLRQFERVYRGFGIRTIEATGETDDITPLLRGRYDIALLTYEKFAAVALTLPVRARTSRNRRYRRSTDDRGRKSRGESRVHPHSFEDATERWNRATGHRTFSGHRRHERSGAVAWSEAIAPGRATCAVGRGDSLLRRSISLPSKAIRANRGQRSGSSCHITEKASIAIGSFR